MDPRTARFVVFSFFALACLAIGYSARKRGWLREEHSRPIHYHTVLWIWSTLGVIALWKMPLTLDLAWLLLLVPATMALSIAISIPLAKAIGCTRPQIGVIAIGTGICNGGAAFGGYLAYCLYSPPETALAYASAHNSLMLLLAIPMLYPILRHYSPDQHDHEVPIHTLIFRSIFDMRSIGLAGAGVGALLSAFKVPYPEVIQTSHLLDVLIYVCAAGNYVGIGLRLRLGDSLKCAKHHALMVGIKYVMLPVITFSALWLITRFVGTVSPMMWQVCVMQSFIPAGTSTVILANLFHLDARLASVVWVFNTVFFLVVVMPGLIWFAH